jgi:hypothetical protein
METVHRTHRSGSGRITTSLLDRHTSGAMLGHEVRVSDRSKQTGGRENSISIVSYSVIDRGVFFFVLATRDLQKLAHKSSKASVELTSYSVNSS